VPAGPTPPERRNLTLDVLHGIALAGVFLVDVPLYATPLSRATRLAPGLDGLVQVLVAALAHTKFLILFTVLFGASMGLLMERASSPEEFLRAYLRRLAFLFLLGALQTALVWHSILLLYVPCALLVLPMRRLPPETQLKAALALLAAGAALPLLVLAFVPDFPSRFREGTMLGLAGEAAFFHGSWSAVAALRLREFARLYAPATALLFGLRTVGLMLLGLWLFRRGLFSEKPGFESALRAWTRRGLGAGAALTLATALAVRPGRASALAALWLGTYFASLALAAGYLALAARACLVPAWRARLRPIALAGRACLSGYAAGSSLFALYAYPFGLGLFGRIGHAACAALALLTFAAVTLASAAWLSRLRFGPLEWLMRGAVYGRLPALRNEA